MLKTSKRRTPPASTTGPSKTTGPMIRHMKLQPAEIRLVECPPLPHPGAYATGPRPASDVDVSRSEGLTPPLAYQMDQLRSVQNTVAQRGTVRAAACKTRLSPQMLRPAPL